MGYGLAYCCCERRMLTQEWPLNFPVYPGIYARFIAELSDLGITRTEAEYDWTAAQLENAHIAVTGYQRPHYWVEASATLRSRVTTWFATGKVLVIVLDYRTRLEGPETIIETPVFTSHNQLLSDIGSTMSVTPRDYVHSATSFSGLVIPSQAVALTAGLSQVHCGAFSPITGGTVLAEVSGVDAQNDGVFMAAERIGDSIVCVMGDTNVSTGSAATFTSYPAAAPDYDDTVELWRRLAFWPRSRILNTL